MIFRRLILGLALSVPVVAAEPSRVEVEQALLRAAKFFREEVSYRGTYLWQYSADLSKREGEGKATKTQGWVQPPGTPSIGMAYLDAWHATKNRYFLDAARETAHALAYCQLRSGGWQHSVELDPELRRRIAYREAGPKKNGRNVTTFDDDTTQSVLRFLAHADAALGFQDERIGDALQYALTSVLGTQHANGAWPQGYDHYPIPDAGTRRPVLKASFPAEWSRTWRAGEEYWRYYTLNDNNLATLVETVLEVARIYEKDESGRIMPDLSKACQKAVSRLGDFLILAQMPDPQPAWAQQYNSEMQPTWARKFEPPAVTGGESQGAMRTLLRIYRETGDPKYLEPIPKALAYLRKSRLADGRLARFYELRTNRPLYFTRDYVLTYDDSDLPAHYSFKVGDQTEAIANEYERISKLPKDQLAESKRPMDRPSAEQVREILADLDERGRWVESGRLRYHGADDDTRQIIRSATFARNVKTLSSYLSVHTP